MARKRTLAGKLAASAGVTRSSSMGGRSGATRARADRGFQFVQDSGQRAGQSYNVKRGASGKAERVYETGDTADTGSRRQGLGGRVKPPGSPSALGTAGARAPRPTVLRQQQQSDIADTAQAAELYRKFLNKQRPSKVKMGLGGRMKMKTRVST
jgi:hypothetical protein